MGSLALGSFLTALVQLFRSYLDYVDRKLRRANNKFAKFILKCLMCCIWLIERLLKYVNQNAYIMIAVYGRGYISSSKNAFNLIMRNVFQTVIVDKVSDFIMILSRLLLTGAAATGSYIWFHQRLQLEMMEDSPDFDHALVPVIVMVFGTILLTANVFSVYDMAVNTLFLCFLEDLERNNGSVQKPYYMSKSLLKLLRKGKGGTEVEGSMTILDALKDPGRLRRPSERADHTAASTRISTVSRRQKALEGHKSSDGSDVDDTRY
ncbi:choline transporter-like protein 2 [Littorina saxatilis]|uniref:choline transporter-like protein 2 n=1 Tax=Littorina saxatilis TaxID=31220 RepID=UPI0038B437D2